LKFTQEQLGRDRRSEVSGHISGPELLDGLRKLALEHFGMLSIAVFKYWGVTSTDDFGHIVFEMIESGEMRMSYRYFDINIFIQSIVNEFVPMAGEKNIKIIFSPAKEGLQVFGDKDKIRQVFVNLLQNAIKYTDEGSIEILLDEEKKLVNISVKDTGIGIPEEDLNRIFERFYRVDKARSRAVGGTGLGLAIVKHIIEAHNSKIIVQSKQGEGSTFSFKLKK
jgi:two-component system phosphate regulon sensor histidine kinase PhoR